MSQAARAVMSTLESPEHLCSWLRHALEDEAFFEAFRFNASCRDFAVRPVVNHNLAAAEALALRHPGESLAAISAALEAEASARALAGTAGSLEITDDEPGEEAVDWS